ncbi:MAG: FAD-dependent oxidoreductase [Clostridia bacterium]|nr:FAD-dependent oxidoreductase [Clostridia bacterium]
MGKIPNYTPKEALGGRIGDGSTFGGYGTDKPNKSILKMAKMITDRMMQPIDGRSPDYYGLAAVADEEMAQIALKMKLRKPKTLDEIQKLTGIEKQHLEDVLEEMCYLGICEFNREEPDHKLRYEIKTFVPGSAEMLDEHAEWFVDHPELAEMFELETYLPFQGFGPVGLTQMIPPGGAGTGMHTIPVEKAIESINTTVDVEHISHWLDKYDKFSVGPCTCRQERHERGAGCVDDPNNWCIGVGDFADYCVQSKKPGHYIDKEEVLRILKVAEDNGFVHQITNIDGKDKIFAICNCDVKICNALRTAMLFNTPNMCASAFRAKVKPDNCVACGRCVEVCPAGAVKLGQKLSLKDGSQIQYPKHDLPDDHFWLKDRWDPDYRDTHREECYETGTAPCKTACPAHIAIQGYLQMAKEGRYDEALELIKRENPFPAVCGRVCNRRCEEACTRGTIDEAVAIDEVKKFIAQRDLFAETRFVPEKVLPSNALTEYDENVAIIGAGPAGLSCAFYLATKGYKPTVFERNAEPGGMMVYGIPSYKLEKNVVAAEIDVLRELGVEIKCGVDVGKDVTLDELRAQGYQAFYLAIGCQGSRKAGIPGEDAADVLSAIDHLAKVHGEKNYTVPKKVVVIGGGNVAVDAARTSARLGGEDVAMYCLESRAEMPASEEEIEETLSENIAIENGWGPKEILTDKKGKVTGVVFKKCTSVFDANHKFAPQYDENDTITVDADYVITSIGQCIDWGNLIDGENIEFVHGNYPKADGFTYQTATEDIFVGGDLYHGPSFVINAIGEGHEAAESIHRFVRPTCDTLTIGREHRHFIELDKDNLSIESYDNSKRQKPELVTGVEIAKTFDEYKKTFTEEQVKIETQRCLSCGASVVDENACIGCGLCTTKCSFDAIHLERTHPEASKMVPCEKRMVELAKYMPKRLGKIIARPIKEAISKK